MLPLLKMLVQLRPNSLFLWLAHFQITLVQGKDLIDRCRWLEALTLLEPLARMPIRTDAQQQVGSWRLALYNMLGTCACMCQDFDRGLGYFRSAMELFQRDSKNLGKLINSRGVSQEAWLEQNIARRLRAHGQARKGGDALEPLLRPSRIQHARSQPVDYLSNLAFEGLNRLAELYTNKERWNSALAFLSRAHKFRPTDADVLERLFHLYESITAPRRGPQGPATAPRGPSQRRPGRTVSNSTPATSATSTTSPSPWPTSSASIAKFPGNTQVGERITSTISNLVPFMEKLYDQWNNQINKVLDQMRRLPSYQIKLAHGPRRDARPGGQSSCNCARRPARPRATARAHCAAICSGWSASATARWSSAIRWRSKNRIACDPNEAASCKGI